MDDSYIYSSLFRTVGQHPAVRSTFTNRYLVSFSLFCLVLFYGLQFLTRPWRLARSVWNLRRQRQETILDQFLAVKARQWLRMRDTWAGAAVTAMTFLE